MIRLCCFQDFIFGFWKFDYNVSQWVWVYLEFIELPGCSYFMFSSHSSSFRPLFLQIISFFCPLGTSVFIWWCPTGQGLRLCSHFFRRLSVPHTRLPLSYLLPVQTRLWSLLVNFLFSLVPIISLLIYLFCSHRFLDFSTSSFISLNIFKNCHLKKSLSSVFAFVFQGHFPLIFFLFEMFLLLYASWCFCWTLDIWIW